MSYRYRLVFALAAFLGVRVVSKDEVDIAERRRKLLENFTRRAQTP